MPKKSCPLSAIWLQFEVATLRCLNEKRGLYAISGWATWSDEDYIGRIARLSRRVSAGPLVTLRVMSRALMAYRRHFEAGSRSEASASSR
jgi:hypothetical protein